MNGIRCSFERCESKNATFLYLRERGLEIIKKFGLSMRTAYCDKHYKMMRDLEREDDVNGQGHSE